MLIRDMSKSIMNQRPSSLKTNKLNVAKEASQNFLQEHQQQIYGPRDKKSNWENSWVLIFGTGAQ